MTQPPLHRPGRRSEEDGAALRLVVAGVSWVDGRAASRRQQRSHMTFDLSLIHSLPSA